MGKKKKQKQRHQQKSASKSKRDRRHHAHELDVMPQSEKKSRFSSLEQVVLDFFKNNEGAKIPVTIVEQVIEIEQAIDRAKIKKAITHLVTLGAIEKNKGGLLSLKPEAWKMAEAETGSPADTFTGVITFNQYGTGFIKSSAFPEDIKVMKKHAGIALPGDEVQFVLISGRGFDRQQGKVIDIIKRGASGLVGTLLSEGPDAFYILPDERNNPYEFYVSKEHLNGAEPQDKVRFSILEWTHPRALPRAEVIEVLGKKGSNEAEIRSIMAANQIKSSFPKEVEAYVDQIPNQISESEIARRLDLRNELIFTIDPVDAKDFDDALSLEILPNGNFYLGVHIADVTHYLKRDSILDKEAVERGTSTYLVDRVIPMLPEKLSNGLCSLNPHEDTLTFSCFMEVDPDGIVVDYKIVESVIHSKFRFAYEDAQAILDGADHEIAGTIRKCWDLASILLKNRMKKGAIDFDTPEPRFVLDEKGTPVSVRVKERLNAHRLIEECMLLANKTVSIHIENLREAQGKKKSKNVYPYLYRVHDKPDREKLANLAELIAPLGIEFSVPDRGIKHSTLNALIHKVKGTPLEFIVNNLLLRSMAKAVYSPKNIGHFGLNFEHYTHFTSPIRRYPDVLVHRLLKGYAQNKYEYTYDELAELGEMCSERERTAMQAERDSVKLKQAEFLSNKIGEEFSGVINGVTEYGMYVLLSENFCEGMVRVNDLTDDYYQYDSKRHTLFGKRRGRKFRLGDEIKIRVLSVDLNQKTIDFALADD